MSRIVSLVNTKGGVGRSTIALGLAATFAGSLRTLLVDTDPQKSASEIAQWPTDVQFDHVRLRSAETMDVLLPKLSYDLVIVDTPQGYGFPQRDSAIRNSDLVLVPTQPSPLDLRGTLRTVSDLLAPAEVPHRVLLNKTSGRQTPDSSAIERFLPQAQLPFMRTIVRKHKALMNSEGWEAVLSVTPSRMSTPAILNFGALAVEVLALLGTEMRRLSPSSV